RAIVGELAEDSTELGMREAASAELPWNGCRQKAVLLELDVVLRDEAAVSIVLGGTLREGSAQSVDRVHEPLNVRRHDTNLLASSPARSEASVCARDGTLACRVVTSSKNGFWPTRSRVCFRDSMPSAALPQLRDPNSYPRLRSALATQPLWEKRGRERRSARPTGVLARQGSARAEARAASARCGTSERRCQRWRWLEGGEERCDAGSSSLRTSAFSFR